MKERAVRIYKVVTPTGARLVRATSGPRALAHVVRLTVKVELASQDDLVSLVGKDGVKGRGRYRAGGSVSPDETAAVKRLILTLIAQAEVLEEHGLGFTAAQMRNCVLSEADVFPQEVAEAMAACVIVRARG